MSAIQLLRIDSPATLSSFPIKNLNTIEQKSPPTVKEKQISFEVKRNNYNRKVEVKTKQEDTICTTKKSISPLSPPIVTCITTRESPLSPRCVSVHQQLRTSSKYFWKSFKKVFFFL
jgi:hypothetical protein